MDIFKKIRIRFVGFAMLAVVIVLAIIVTLINIINYRNVTENADDVLDLLAEHGGRFPSDVFPPKGSITVETPYQTRYFSVLIVNADGVLLAYPETSMVKAVSDDDAYEYTKQVFYGQSARGYVDNYRYYSTTYRSQYLVVFMDCTTLLSAARDFLTASLIIAAAGAAVVAIAIALLSKKIVAPIANSYLKQRQFITNASHELKTPLTIISANSELIELESGTSPSTDSIQRQVARMNSMVKNMSALAMLEEAGTMRESETFDISAAASDAAESISPAVNAKGKSLSVDIQDGIKFTGNENLIRQLFGILTENALKYCASKIKLSVEKKQKIEITVSNDTGGIEKGNLEHCFERFYRASDVRASGVEGSGIGLSVAKEIAVLHKGKISATSPDGMYFVIKVIL